MFCQTVCTERVDVLSDCALSRRMFCQCALSRWMFCQTVCPEQADVLSDSVYRAGGCSVRQCAMSRRMFFQTMCTEQAMFCQCALDRQTCYQTKMCTEQEDVRSGINLHREGGYSVRQCALSRRMFGQT